MPLYIEGVIWPKNPPKRGVVRDFPAKSFNACNFFKNNPICFKFETLVELNKPFAKIAKPEVEIDIQDGCRRHIENAQIAISQEPFDRFHSNLNHRCITTN